MITRSKRVVSGAVLAAFISTAAVAPANAAGGMGEISTKCQQVQSDYHKGTDKVAEQIWLKEPMAVAVGKQPVNVPWSGIPFSNCLDLLPSGFSLTLTIPTLEMVLEQIIKMIAQKICDVMREQIRNTVGELTSQMNGSVSMSSLAGGMGGLNLGGVKFGTSGARVGNIDMPSSSSLPSGTTGSYRAATGVVAAPSASAPPAQPGMVVSGSPATGNWNPTVVPGKSAAPSADRQPADDSVWNKAKCVFGGSCQK